MFDQHEYDGYPDYSNGRNDGFRDGFSKGYDRGYNDAQNKILHALKNKFCNDSETCLFSCVNKGFCELYQVFEGLGLTDECDLNKE